MVCVVIAQGLKAVREKLAEKYWDTAQEMPCHGPCLQRVAPHLLQLGMLDCRSI